MSEQIPRLYYTKSWEDPADFSTRESSEIQNRKDIQSLFTELRLYNNDTLLPALEKIISGGSAGGSGGGGLDPDLFLPIGGGTMRGPLLLYRNPRFESEAATRAYVDNADSEVLAAARGDISALENGLSACQNDINNLDNRAREIESSVSQIETSVDQAIADKISLQISQPETDGDKIYARITLKAGPHETYGYILMEGNVDVSGQLSADALYAAYGEIADLAVDRLSTSRRIVKYLNHDQSDDNYIRIQNQEIAFVTGNCTGEREQAKNPAGQPLFWPRSVSGLSPDENGYPITTQNERIFTTTTPTNWPVYVYIYQEAVKRRIKFEANPDSGVYEPADTYGAGNEQGYNYARVTKSTEGFDLIYITPVGKEIGVHMDAGGYLDFTGTRKTNALNFSSWSDGLFTESRDGLSNPIEYHVEFDADNRPVKITDSSGHETVISW